MPSDFSEEDWNDAQSSTNLSSIWETFKPKLSNAWVSTKELSKEIWEDRWNHHVSFMAIWLLTFIGFCVLLVSSATQLFVTLPTYNSQLQSGVVYVFGIDLTGTINGLVTSYNQNVEALQASIRSSARVSFGLNLLSALCALCGLATQFRQYLQEKRH